MTGRIHLFATILLLAAAPPAAAQVALSVGAGRYSPDIEILPGIDAGPGIDGSVRVGVTEWLELAAGVQYNRHSVGEASDRYEVVVPFVESRFVIPVGSPRWVPFLAPRAGWVRHSLHLFGQEVSGSGHLWGGMAGVAFRASDAVDIEAAFVWYRASVRDVDLDLGDFDLRLDDLTADVPGVRAAVAWRTF